MSQCYDFISGKLPRFSFCSHCSKGKLHILSNRRLLFKNELKHYVCILSKCLYKHVFVLSLKDYTHLRFKEGACC